MKPKVYFYTLDYSKEASSKDSTAASNDLEQAEPAESVEKKRVCDWALAIATKKFRAKRGVFIQAASQEEAEGLDENLWVREPDSFVPHRLVSESPQQFAPVVIGFEPHQGMRSDTYINLAFDAQQIPENFHQYREIIDFVSEEEDLKEIARARFRAYRQAGCQLSHQAISQAET